MTTAIAGFIAVLGTTGFAQWFKNTSANYTRKQVHVAVCIIAGALTIIWAFATNDPSFWNWIYNAIVLATASVGTFEMFLKGIGSATTPPTTAPLSTMTS